MTNLNLWPVYISRKILGKRDSFRMLIAVHSLSGYWVNFFLFIFSDVIIRYSFLRINSAPHNSA